MRRKMNEVVSKVILIRADTEGKGMIHSLTFLQERREGDKREERRAVRLLQCERFVSGKEKMQGVEMDRRKEKKMNGVERRTH